MKKKKQIVAGSVCLIFVFCLLTGCILFYKWSAAHSEQLSGTALKIYDVMDDIMHPFTYSVEGVRYKDEENPSKNEAFMSYIQEHDLEFISSTLHSSPSVVKEEFWKKGSHSVNVLWCDDGQVLYEYKHISSYDEEMTGLDE